MKLKYLILFLYFFSYCQTNAQNELSNKQIDSLLKINAAFIHKNPSESIKLANKTYLASKRNNYDLGAAMSLYKISIYHSEILKDYKKALSYNDEGSRIARKINNDSILLFFNFSRAVIYGSLEFKENAIKLLDECLKKTNSLENPIKRSLFRGDLFTYKLYFIDQSASSQTHLKYSLEAMKEYEKALDHCVNPGYTNVGYYYMELKQYEKASYYLKKAVRFFKLKNTVTCEVEYTNLGTLNLKMGQYEAALKYLDSSNAICLKTPHTKYYFISKNYQGYKDVYTKMNEKDSIIKYQNLELRYTDSLASQTGTQRNQSLDYMVSKNEDDNARSEEDKRIIILISIAGTLLISTLIIVYYWRRNNSIKNQGAIKEKNLEKNLDQKTTEIQQLKQKVSTSYDELIEMAKKDNPLFVSFFKELYPEFYKKIKEIQPDLTVLEQKVCFYLKLKFTTKEIADYTFVSIKAIQNRKNRLRKRLFVEEGQDIYDWIDQIDK